MCDPYAKTRKLYLALFERVRDGEMTPDEAADKVVGALKAGARVREEVDAVLDRHIRGLARRA